MGQTLNEFYKQVIELNANVYMYVCMYVCMYEHLFSII